MAFSEHIKAEDSFQVDFVEGGYGMIFFYFRYWV